jgi:hypothetical protein
VQPKRIVHDAPSWGTEVSMGSAVSMGSGRGARGRAAAAKVVGPGKLEFVQPVWVMPKVGLTTSAR